jgi:hypothetical protein
MKKIDKLIEWLESEVSDIDKRDFRYESNDYYTANMKRKAVLEEVISKAKEMAAN